MGPMVGGSFPREPPPQRKYATAAADGGSELLESSYMLMIFDFNWL